MTFEQMFGITKDEIEAYRKISLAEYKDHNSESYIDEYDFNVGFHEGFEAVQKIIRNRWEGSVK